MNINKIPSKLVYGDIHDSNRGLYQMVENFREFRFPKGFLFESKGSMCYFKNDDNLTYILALMNTKVVGEMLLILAPTLDYHEGPMSKVPTVIDADKKEVVGDITGAINGLLENEQKGSSVEKIFGVVSNYRYIFVSRNYVFYSIENDSIKIINIYNEKEDFMWQLFGVDTTPQETIDYWSE